MSSTARWGGAALAALALTVGLAVAVKKRQRLVPPPPKELPRPVSSAAPCAVPAATTVRALPGAEDRPVLLWAVGEVRVLMDNAPAYSAPEDPKHFKVGEHALSVEAEGSEPLRTRARLDAFTPALFHAEVDPQVGLTLVRLGSVCAACREPLDKVSLEFSPAPVRSEVMFQRAASSLRGDDWLSAAAFLKGVPRPSRTNPLYRRLAAGVYADAFQSAQARAELEAIPTQASHDLKDLLKHFDVLTKREAARRREVARARWNKVTERFQGIIDRFNTQAPGPTAVASHRLAALSSDFDEAARRDDIIQQEKLLEAAEEALLSVVVQVRAARPDDCDFQGRVVATVMR